jgi:pimeloyl-ACP methyl ester carboxylesterase
VGGDVSAYLVIPPGEGPFAGIVFLHWYAPSSATNNRTEFLQEAVDFAHKGVISILLQGILPWKKSPSGSEYLRDRSLVIQEVLEARRGIDLLLSRSDVDPERIAVVGHDFGGMYASVLAGIDRRVKACVYIAGTGRFSDWFITYWNPASTTKDEYRAGMAAVDPIQYLPHISPAAILFQFGEDDVYIRPEAAQAQYEAALEPKSILWYRAGHALDQQARMDRVQWLEEQLGLSVP